MNQPSAAPRKELSLYDATAIIVGIVIGSSVYVFPPLVAQWTPSAEMMLSFWVVGGLFALAGSLCYAELATAYPADGGDYVYLQRAYGRPVSFLFAWLQLGVVRPGSIGAMALVFARYATQLAPLGERSQLVYAVAAVVALAAINLFGVSAGKWTQNVLATSKLLGLLIIFVAGLLVAAPAADVSGSLVEPADAPINVALLGQAMIMIMFAYGGWNEMAYVAAEVREPEKNIFRALLLGTSTVIVIYLLANGAMLRVLGFEGIRHSQAVAADVAQAAFGPAGSRLTSLLICVSALGAIAGMTFTGSRVYYAMGRDHRLFAPLGRWNARLGTPVWSLVIEATITTATIVAFSLFSGPNKDSFASLVNYTTPPFWFFLALSGLSVVVLRRREPERPRPVRVPGYPVLPLLFVLGCVAMVYASLDYAIRNRSWEALWPLTLLVIGVVLYWVDRGKAARSPGGAGG